MVSKLLLAVQECSTDAVNSCDDEVVVGKMLEHFYEINEGIGVHKSPKLYGAYPIDPYSHTPFGKGVQQPGMTGQVKEDILTRIGELGISVVNGEVQFSPCLLRANEFLQEDKTFDYISANQESKSISLTSGNLAFTYCQVPVVYEISDSKGINVALTNGESTSLSGQGLSAELSQDLFKRSGTIERITVSITKEQLR